MTETASIGRLYTALTGSPSPVLLLGAGASIRSGVPLAGTMVEKAARWAYARELGRPDDQRIQRSDWLPWLRSQNWLKPDLSLADNYAPAVEYLLQPRQARADFFRQILRTNIAPSVGYEALAEFLHLGHIRNVLTTNFDDLLNEVRILKRRPHSLETIRTQSDYTKFSTSPQYPQLVYLHGSVEHYTDKNIVNEVQALDPGLVAILTPLLRDHPLIVVGYRGAEPSIMRHLLMSNLEVANGYRHGIFWCRRKSDLPEDGPPLLHDLATAAAGNFSYVEIDGFDELFARDLWQLHQDAQALPARRPLNADSTAPTLDMSPVEVIGLEHVDWATLRIRIIQYCQALQIRVPSEPDRVWIREQLLQANLASVDNHGRDHLTIAGHLLFAIHPQEQVASASVVVRISGPDAWLARAANLSTKVEGSNSGDIERKFDGNLWVQYESINDVLTAFNRPFRLKGEVSTTVLPYPPLALKEAVVNALVHRDYSAEGPIVIDVSPGSVRISNPGGLVDEVMRRVEDESIEERIRRGQRGIKGYRNPVLADLFYGSGEMDKAGSGLSDIYRTVKANGGDVRLGPNDDNTAFSVELLSRPEAVDDITGTAVPEIVTSATYAANLLEVSSLPSAIYHAEATIERAPQIWRDKPGIWTPPFLLLEGRIWSFHDLDHDANSLSGFLIKGTVETLSVAEFEAAPDGERRLAWLLNQCVEMHFRNCGLIVDRKRKRAYFPRTLLGTRTITYQARLRRATRTVVKSRVSSRTGKITYWEHESIGYRFDKFAQTWALVLEPGYVFTFNGAKGLLAPEKVNKLSTRRAARDYNNAVHNDLSFWSWLLAKGETGSFPLELAEPAGDEITLNEKIDDADEADHDERWALIRQQQLERRAAASMRPGWMPQLLLASRLPSVTLNELNSLPHAVDDTIDMENDELENELEALADEQRENAELEIAPEEVEDAT